MAKIKYRLATITQRRAIPVKSTLHTERLAKGLSLGYRRGKKGGVWYARKHQGGVNYIFQELGLSDDAQLVADGVKVLTFDQAAAVAREWFADENASSAGISRKPYTVGDACDAWLKKQTGTTGKTHVEQHIRPALGHIRLDKLTKGKLYDWHQELGAKPPVWAAKGAEGAWKVKAKFDINDPETRRQRQDTANRVLRSLRAILTLAYENGKVKSNAAWDTLKPFERTGRMREDYLTPDEAKRFIEVCKDDFRKMVMGALFTGCRYGELCALKVSAYDAHLHVINVLQGKTQKTKTVFLSDDEIAFFEELTADRKPDEFMFLRADSEQWAKDHQRERMKEACSAAKITKDITFHNLRHTFGSLLAMGGARRELLQKQLGHSSPRMTDRYTHFEQSWEQKAVRSSKPSFGVVKGRKVTEMPKTA
jgi:integrase